MGIEPSAEMVRALYQSDSGRRELSREVVSSGKSCYASSEDDYMWFFPPAEQNR